MEDDVASLHCPLKRSRIRQVGDKRLRAQAGESGNAAPASNLSNNGVAAGAKAGHEDATEGARCASYEDSHGAQILASRDPGGGGRCHRRMTDAQCDV
ncbi:MAG: hypothetical protein NVS4B3_04450 [Gemmatimonadaceae bacterium]